eukprot:271637_1
MRTETITHSQTHKIHSAPPFHNNIRVSKESVFGDFTCVLRGYSYVLSLREMQDKAAHTHQVDVGRERKIACSLICFSIIFILLLCVGYYFLIFELYYDLQDGLIIIMEIFCVLSFLIIGMCMFRWCSLRDVSPSIIWKRVAQTQCSPLKLIQFDMEHVNVTYFEYTITYGEYPHKLHEPIITLIKKHKICNARDLVKITKKDPDTDKDLIQNNESYSKYGAVYFHFKGDDDYLLERWKYEFGKYNVPLLHVYRQCSKFNHVFHTHFDNRFRIRHDNHNVKSKYINYNTSMKDKEDNIISILGDLGDNMMDKTDVSDDDDDYYHNTHDYSYSNSGTGHILHSIHPRLIKNNNNHKRHKLYNSVKPHTPSHDYVL